MPKPNPPQPFCMLPGCQNLVEQPADGTSLRKYCSQEHRIEARRQRQRMRAEQAITERPASARPSDVTSRPKTRREKPSNRDAVRRSVLAVGTAALLAVTVVQVARTPTSDSPAAVPRSSPPTSVRPQPPASQTPDGPAVPPDLAVWAKQAQTALIAVEAQLGQVHAAEAELQKLSKRSRARLGPNRARELAERKNQLLAQHAVLGTAMDAYAALPRTQESLQATERRLAAVDNALRAQPDDRSEALTRQLTEQRETLRRKAESLREEQTRWRRTVDAAATAPLSADADAKGAARLLDEIFHVIRQPEPDRPRPDRPRRDRPTRPRDTQPGLPPTHDNSAGRARDDTPIGAPPRPSRPARRLDRPAPPGSAQHPILPPPQPSVRPKPRPPERPGCTLAPKPATKAHQSKDKNNCVFDRPKPRPPERPGCPPAPKPTTKTHHNKQKCKPGDKQVCRVVPFILTSDKRIATKPYHPHQCPSLPKPKPPDKQVDKCSKDKTPGSVSAKRKHYDTCKQNKKGEHKKDKNKKDKGKKDKKKCKNKGKKR